MRILVITPCPLLKSRNTEEISRAGFHEQAFIAGLRCKSHGTGTSLPSSPIRHIRRIFIRFARNMP